jgi:hypothetical protein
LFGVALVVHELGLEAELVGDMTLAVAHIVYVDLVEHIVAELVEVRRAFGRLEWDIVGDECDGVVGVRGYEHVEIRAVCVRVGRDQRRFAVARRADIRWGERDQQARDQDEWRQRDAEQAKRPADWTHMVASLMVEPVTSCSFTTGMCDEPSPPFAINNG